MANISHIYIYNFQLDISTITNISKTKFSSQSPLLLLCSVSKIRPVVRPRGLQVSLDLLSLSPQPDIQPVTES